MSAVSSHAQNPAMARALIARSLATAAGWETPVLLRASKGTSVFAAGPLVIRLAEPGRSPLNSKQQAAMAVGLAAAGAAVVQPADFPDTWSRLLEDPNLLGADELGLWWRVERGYPLTPVALAEAIAAVHRIDPDAMPVAAPGFGVFGRLVAELDELGDHPLLAPNAGRVGAFLAAAADEMAGTPSVLLHGDVNRGNVLTGPGRVVLCDLEFTMTGPALWDLTGPAGDLLLGRSPQCDPIALLDAYDGEAGPLWRTVAQLRATSSVLFRIAEYAAGTTLGDEAPAVLARLLSVLP